ncbi:MAG: ATP-grasp domain-containing protein [Nitrospinota bacterium]
MLKALLSDLSKADEWEVSTLLDSLADADRFKANRIALGGGNFFSDVESEMKKSDAVWIIAPESGENLLKLTRLAESLGKNVIGPDSGAVDVCGDKLKMYERLRGIVPTPHTEQFNTGFSSFPCVVKPRYGAGCEKVFKLNSKEALKSFNGNGENGENKDEFIIQTFAAGKTLSAAILNGIDGFSILGVCRQVIKNDSNLIRVDSIRPLSYQNLGKLKKMVGKIIETIPGLRGYWGIDFNDHDGEPALIEINPRITASYPYYSKMHYLNISLPPAEIALHGAMGKFPSLIELLASNKDWS